uniref:Si946076e12 n=1 Tax=Arundo donax TaxID=35708 RepID=A0A0A9E526_ARUDO
MTLSHFSSKIFTASVNSTSGGIAPVDSMVKMKWSLTRLCSIFWPVGPMTHSLQSVHALGLATTALFPPFPRSSMSKTLTGHFFTSSSAASPSITSSLLIATSGSILYQAVATGDHLA